jgi:hypothetical protein
VSNQIEIFLVFAEADAMPCEIRLSAVLLLIGFVELLGIVAVCVVLICSRGFLVVYPHVFFVLLPFN